MTHNKARFHFHSSTYSHNQTDFHAGWSDFSEISLKTCRCPELALCEKFTMRNVLFILPKEKHTLTLR